jgi:OOP family OmpA-OmpF porin
MTKKWLVSMLGVAAMGVSAGALAQQSMVTVPNFYAGVEVGQTDFGTEDDTGFKILGGYQFHRNIAAEIGYGLLFDKGGGEVTAFDVVAVGMFPLTPYLSAIGKIGLAMWEAEVDTPVGRFSDDGTDITWALGLQYDVTRNLALRLQWQRYEVDPDSADFLNLGLIWRF